ncbi:DMT family transporter [Pseudoalteromonas sp. YIC-827]|uniref:DMT family transporter n=1 Tax=Pseudoalteromonas qingdaonensis TaxID=3131913 RepID=A0ABU9N016_9GAMM
MTWIFFTFLAAFSQSWRNALQSKLSQHTASLAVTLARFILAGPIAALYLAGLYQFEPAPALKPSGVFIFYVIGAAVMQIIATALMVRLFKMNNYAVGAGLAKSEALVAAILGMLFFGSALSLLGWLGVILGAVAVILLSGPSIRGLNFKTVALGLACGTSFALTSLWVREASLSSGLVFPHSAAWVLLLVISLQTILLLIYLGIKDRVALLSLWRHKGLTLWISLTSCIGSIGWFSAMSLQHVAYVKTLGQVEIFFTLAISYLWLKQPVKRRDSLGLFLIALAAIAVMWG